MNLSFRYPGCNSRRDLTVKTHPRVVIGKPQWINPIGSKMAFVFCNFFHWIKIDSSSSRVGFDFFWLFVSYFFFIIKWLFESFQFFIRKWNLTHSFPSAIWSSKCLSRVIDSMDKFQPPIDLVASFLSLFFLQLFN